MALASLFHKKQPMAKIDCSIMVYFCTKNKMAVHELAIAVKQWQKTFGDEEQETMFFNDSDSTASKFRIYFSPYTAECFISFYKNLIDQEHLVPDTGGKNFGPVPVNMGIFYNTFLNKTTKDSNGNIHPVLDSVHEVKKYQASKRKGYFLSDNFNGILFMLNRILFFYNYTTAGLASNEDPSSEYKANKRLALYIRRIYMAEHALQPNQIATIPSYRDFEQQNESSVYIPALVSSSATIKNTHPDSSAGDDTHSEYIKKYRQQEKEKEEASEVSLSPTAKSLKAESDRAASKAMATSKRAKSEFASKKASASSKASSVNTGRYSSSVANSSTSVAQKKSALASIKAKLLNGEPASSSATSVASASIASASVPSSKAEKPSSSSTSAPVKVNSANAGDLIDAKEFAKKKFPRTDKPTVVRGAIQLLLDNNPQLFHTPFKFQRFNVDKQLPAPAPIQEAIKTGHLNNQEYVLQMDNSFKKTANEVIDSRANVLDMSYTRMLTDMLFGAYAKINNKVSALLSEEMKDKALTASAQKYYNDHFNKENAKLQTGRKTELDAIDKSLYDEYKSKKDKEDGKINARYDKEQRDLGIKVNSMANDVFYKAKASRDKTLDEQIDDLRKSDMKNVNLQIKNYQIEFGHKLSIASQMLFSFLNKRLQARHDKAKTIVSDLIKKQIMLNKSKSNLQQANIAIARSKSRHQYHSQWAKEQQKMQSYIDTLSNQIDKYESQLSDIRVADQKDKSKMNEALIKNRSLQAALDNAKAMLNRNKDEIVRGKDNYRKYQEAKQKAEDQQAELANERANFNAKNSSLIAQSSVNSARASQSASISASAQVAEAKASFATSNDSYQTRIFNLQNSLSSANAEADSRSTNINSLRAKLLDAQTTMTNYRTKVANSKIAQNKSLASYAAQFSNKSRKASLSASSSASAQISANNSFLAKNSKSYADKVQEYQEKLDSAQADSQANVSSLGDLKNKLAKTSNSFSTYRLSVATSDSVHNASVASYNRSVNDSISAKNANYQSMRDSYHSALIEASATNASTSSASKKMKRVNKAFASYKQSVADSNKAQASKASKAKSSAEAVASSYRSGLTSAMNALSKASKADGDTFSAKAQLDKVKQSFSDYQTKVSNANSLRDSSENDHDKMVKASYKAQISAMAKNQSQASATASIASKANNSSASKAADSRALTYQKSLSATKAAFDSYRSSVSASDSLEKKAIASSNSATSSVMSSATYSSDTSTKPKLSSTSQVQKPKIRKSKAYNHSSVASSSATNNGIKEEVYNPNDDELEQRKLQQVQNLKKRNEQLTKQAEALKKAKHRKGFHLWNL